MTNTRCVTVMLVYTEYMLIGNRHAFQW